MKPEVVGLALRPFALVVLALVAGCAGETDRVGVDAGTDITVVDDLRPTDATDGSFEDWVEAHPEAGVDVPMDVRPDVPGVMLGGYFIPVDPNAVPPPGSECVGDGGVREGDPTVAPPRPIRPLSVSRVTSQRPTFQWALPEGTTGARVEVCADRCCTRVLQTLDAEGTTVRPTVALPAGVVFWRMFGRRGTTVGSRASYTWEFGVRRRDAPNDTSWGTIHDFDGDGFDDLFVFRSPGDRDRPTELLLMSGSSEGLRAPVATGVTGAFLGLHAVIGDFNGDGRSDVAWDDRDYYAVRSWFSIVNGTTGTPVAHVLPSFSLLGSCALVGQGGAIDWNGDGYSDLAMTVSFGCNRSVPVEASILLVYAGSSQGLSTVPQEAWRVDGLLPHSLVWVRTGLGDIDLDGYGDVAAASLSSGPGTTSVRDEIAVFFGGSRETRRVEVIPEPLPRSGGWGNYRVQSVGDVDGNGHIDVLVDSYVYRQPAGLRVPSSRLPFRSPWTSSGDLNGDGFSDVIVAREGEHDEERWGIPYNRGRVHVFPGSPMGVSSESAVIATRRLDTEEEAVFFRFGGQAMSPGDVNGDGIDDLVCLDEFERRLCLRFGRTNFSGGLPDRCMNDVTTGRTAISTYIF